MVMLELTVATAAISESKTRCLTSGGVCRIYVGMRVSIWGYVCVWCNTFDCVLILYVYDRFFCLG